MQNFGTNFPHRNIVFMKYRTFFIKIDIDVEIAFSGSGALIDLYISLLYITIESFVCEKKKNSFFNI
jgi:hypothetical protein